MSFIPFSPQSFTRVKTAYSLSLPPSPSPSQFNTLNYRQTEPLSKIVEFNNNKIKNTTNIVTVTDKETEEIESALKYYMESVPNKALIIEREYSYSEWKRYPIEIKHPLTEVITNYFNNELRNIFPNQQVTLSGEIFLLAERVVSERRSIIQFKCYIKSSDKFMTRRLIVQILVNEDTKQIIQVNKLLLDISNDSQKTQLINPRPLNKEYIETLNKLFLNLPFQTNEKEIQISQEDRDKWEERIHTSSIVSQEQDYMCYHSQNTQAATSSECINSGGVWDRSVGDSEECPFYKANTNYPNDYGKARGYGCDMPENVERRGFRYYSADPKHVPLCYNCKTDLIGRGTLGKCCESQYNASLYPSLNGPDYAYKGDENVRRQYKTYFDYRNLSID